MTQVTDKPSPSWPKLIVLKNKNYQYHELEAPCTVWFLLCILGANNTQWNVDVTEFSLNLLCKKWKHSYVAVLLIEENQNSKYINQNNWIQQNLQ
jgi:hypothetical protein